MATSAPQVSSPVLQLLRSTLRVLRRTGLVLLGSVAALGAVTSPQTSLLLGAGCAVLAWVPVRLLSRCTDADLPPLPHPAVPATRMAVLPAAVAGTAPLGLGALGLVGAVLGVAVVLGCWAASCAVADPPPTGHDAAPEPDDGSLRVLLRTLPVEVLFQEWRDTAGQAVPGGEDAEDRIRLRGLLIDELRRRDPVGVGRWLAEAPEDPPEGYVRESRDRTS
ncbi:hypothetical protein ACI79C_22820 [Geodermatophilus sp. SYSU D00697]